MSSRNSCFPASTSSRSPTKRPQATTLVLGSDLDAIVKTSRDQLLVFAQDMKTGKGAGGPECWSRKGGQIVLDAATGADGVLLRDWSPPARRQWPAHTILLLDGPHVAGWGWGARPGLPGSAAGAYIYTDRPAYRPGTQGLDPRRGPRGRRRSVRPRAQC